MKYLLDTNALIDFSKQWEPRYSRILALIEAEDVGVCPINVAEFYAGLAPAMMPVWDTFFARLAYWPISREAAARAGQWRYAFARRGQPLSTTDTLIAAVALEQGAVVVTSNVRDYPMEGVELLPLTQ
jgi:predicted nucleic acid-binding protein